MLCTAQQLSCGCIDREERGGIRVTLWREHGVYHVRAYNFNEHLRLAWDSFHTLAKARKAYRAMQCKYLPV